MTATDFASNIFRAKRKFRLSSTETELLLALTRDGATVVTSAGLPELLGCNERTIRRTLRELERRGLLTCLTPGREVGGRGQRLEWRIHQGRRRSGKEGGHGPSLFPHGNPKQHRTGARRK
jgi:predicted ArsR family transcriptional regulator